MQIRHIETDPQTTRGMTTLMLPHTCRENPDLIILTVRALAGRTPVLVSIPEDGIDDLQRTLTTLMRDGVRRLWGVVRIEGSLPASTHEFIEALCSEHEELTIDFEHPP